MRGPCAEMSMDKKDCSSFEGSHRAITGNRGDHPLAASQGAETFIAPPEEITSTMGTAHEAADGVDKVPK